MQRIQAKAKAGNTPYRANKCNHCWLKASLALLAFLIVGAVQQAHAQTYTVLHIFAGTDGNEPTGNVVMDTAGNLYSTTIYGGSAFEGTMFKLPPNGTENVLYNFADGSDGGSPVAGPVMDASGNLYGTTNSGGSQNCSGGCGIVYKISPSGTETVLYSFTGANGDGYHPNAGLVMDKSGNLYGMTSSGGNLTTANCSPSGCGIVFKVDARGRETVLHTFTGGTDGGYPEGGHLIMDKSGNLYGTTSSGGAINTTNCGSYGCGTVFKLDTRGRETVLYSFGGSGDGITTDGASPASGLTMDAAGNLYGTTGNGGPSYAGTVFKLDTTGHETMLYAFTGANGDGAYPYGTVVMDAAGNLYGTTGYGGYYATSGECQSGCGTVFKVDTSHNETVLHTFMGTPQNDGEIPQSDLTMDAAGNLYGTTFLGGSLSTDCSNPPFYGCGTVFKLTFAVPFSAFNPSLTITSGRAPGFQLSANLTQGAGASAINPVTQGMMLTVGSYNVVIPAGSFKAGKGGAYSYQGTLNGVALKVTISPSGAGSYVVQATGSGVSPAASNPVTVTLTLGQNSGTANVNAQFQ